MKYIVALLLLVLVACTDFAHPSELDHAQIIGVRADPPVVEVGQRSRLELLVAGPDGPGNTAATWSVESGGHLELEAGVTYLVADRLADVSVDVATETEGRVLTARKWIRVADEQVANPVMTQLVVGGRALAEGETAVLDAGAAVPLSFDTVPAAGDRALVSWYTTAGSIDRYRLANPELIANPEAGTGWLIVVYRDGDGGMCWRTVRVEVR